MTQIAKKVAEAMTEINQGTLSPELANALRLAELYENIKPNEYILPLNALAGIPVYERSEALAETNVTYACSL